MLVGFLLISAHIQKQDELGVSAGARSIKLSEAKNPMEWQEKTDLSVKLRCQTRPWFVNRKGRKRKFQVRSYCRTRGFFRGDNWGRVLRN
jgi:hypothetical protein